MVGINSYREQVAGQLKLVQTNEVYKRLTSELFYEGEVSYSDVIDSDRDYFTSQLSYITLLSSQLMSYVTLYKTLGGDI